MTIDTETWNKLSGVPDGSKVDFAVRSEGNAWHFAMKQLPSRRLLLEVKITRLRSRRTLFRVNIRFNTLVSEIGGLLTKLFGEVRQMDHTREAWKALCELGPIKEVSQGVCPKRSVRSVLSACADFVKEHTRSGCLNVVTIQSPPNCPLWTSLGCFDLTYKANHSSTVTTVLELNLGDGSRSHLPRLSVRFEDDEVIRERIELAFRNGTEDNRPIGPIRSSFGMGNSNSVARALRSLDKAVAHDSGLDALRARQLLLQ